MRIYISCADVNRYRGLYYTEEDVMEFARRFDGTPMKSAWKVRESFSFVPRLMPKGDCPNFGTHVPVFNPRSVEILADLLEGNGELLPIRCDGEDYFLFNVTRVVDALDQQNSDLDLFDDGDILEIDRHVFIPEKLPSLSIFKIPQMVLADVFVTDPFVDRVESAGLKGFDFELVWSND